MVVILIAAAREVKVVMMVCGEGDGTRDDGHSQHISAAVRSYWKRNERLTSERNN